jgi:hypothetical protein
MRVTSGGGEVEMCAIRSLASFVPLALRGFFAVGARRGVWRLPFFFVGAGAADCGNDGFTSPVVFVFFGTGVQWLNDFNSLSFIGPFASAFSF